MGYRRGDHAAPLRLTFEDPSLEGLQVTHRRLAVGEHLDVLELVGADGFRLLPENRERLEQVAAAWAATVIEWNLEDDETGEPIAPTADALLAQDGQFMLAVVDAWVTAPFRVPRPLPVRQPETPPSVALDLLSDFPTTTSTPEPAAS